MPPGLCHSNIRLLSWCLAHQPASLHCSWVPVFPAECRAGTHLGSRKGIGTKQKCAVQFSTVKYSGVSKFMTSTSSSPELEAVSASETLAPSSPGLRTISGCGLGGRSSGAPCSSQAVVGGARDRSLFVFVHKNSQKSLSWVVSVTSFI